MARARLNAHSRLPSREQVLPVLRSATQVEMSRARPASGVQRAVVMGLVLFITQAWFGWGMAVDASVAALLIGILDVRQNPRNRLRTMTLGTVLLATTTFTTHELSPWHPAVLALLVLFAFGEGAGIAIHRDAPIVLQMSGIVAATALLEPAPRADSWKAALVVLAGGGAQALLSALFAARRHVVREVEIAADAMEDVSRALHAAGTSPVDAADKQAASAALERSTRSLSVAQAAIDASDLKSDLLMSLREALFATDQLRAEAAAVVVQQRSSTSPLHSSAAERLPEHAELLHRGAGALMHRTGMPAVLVDAPPEDPRARTYAAAVQTLLATERWGRRNTSTPENRRRRTQAALDPSGMPFRFGLRVALASLAAGLVGNATNLTHASWSVNACLSVLRPDGGGLFSRFLLRAGATAVAAAAVVLEVMFVGGDRIALATLAVIYAGVMFALGPTNYGIYGLMVTMSVLSLVAITSPTPEALAVDRLVDTVVGCALALVAGLAVPVWKVTQLPDEVATYCTTLAQRFEALSQAISQLPDARDPVMLHTTGIKTRDAVSHVLMTLATASTEPAGMIPVARLRTAFDELRGSARLAVVAEALLTDGHAASARAAALADQTAAALYLLADGVRQNTPIALPDYEADPTTELERVLQDAYDSVERAARIGWADARSATSRQ